MIESVLMHAGIEVLGIGAAACAQKKCMHLWHRRGLAAALVVVNAALSVAIIG